MIELKIKRGDINRIHNLLKELEPETREGALHKGILKAASTVVKALVANTSGLILKRRTGNLARSIGFRIERDSKGTYEAIIGSGASLRTARMIYANIHERGGTIRPKHAKMLAIPIGEALTPAGVARFKPREITESGYDASFFRRSDAGNLILFGKRGGKILPLFVMKDKVKIPARRYMSITVDQTKDKVVDDILNTIREAKRQA